MGYESGGMGLHLPPVAANLYSVTKEVLHSIVWTHCKEMERHAAGGHTAGGGETSKHNPGGHAPIPVVGVC